MEKYFTILKEEESEIIEKKSKFIATIIYVENLEDVEIQLKKVKKKYHDARHNCFAYRILDKGQFIEKSSDDGEPSGTAGAPMLNILQKRELCNILVVVTRYFGGILLGTGGLVRAYSEATQKVIEKTTLINKVRGVEITLKIDYANLENFKHYCKNNEIKIDETNYLEDINLKIKMEKNRKNIFLNDIKTKVIEIKEIQDVQEKYISKNVEKVK